MAAIARTIVPLFPADNHFSDAGSQPARPMAPTLLSTAMYL